MKPIAIFVLGLVLTSSGPAWAQKRAGPDDKPAPPKNEPRPPSPRVDTPTPQAKREAITLANVSSLFQLSDVDQDGSLDLKEAGTAGLGPRDCTAADFDKDQKLTSREFVVAYYASVTRAERPVAREFSEEAAKIASAATAKEVEAQQGQPTPIPVRQATPPPDAKTELERKIAEALRGASGSGKSTEDVRERAADPATPLPGVDAKAAQAQADLNRRLRNAEVTPEQAAQERSDLRRRIDNAQQQRASAAGATAPEKAGGASDSAAAATPLSAADKARENLDRRLQGSGASADTAATEKTKLEQRIQNAKGPQGADANQPTAPAKAGATNPPAASPSLSAADKARQDLDRRLQGSGASADTAATQKTKLEQRIQNAAGKPAGEANKPAPAASQSAADKAREDLQRRLDGTGASADKAATEKAKLEQRIQNADGTKPQDAKKKDAPPAPAASAEERARAAREALEKRLESGGVKGAEADQARQRLDKLLKKAQEGDAAGKKGDGATAKATGRAKAPPAAGQRKNAPAGQGKGAKRGASGKRAGG